MILHKKKGARAFIDYISVIVFLSIMTITLVFFTNYSRYMDTCNELDNIARKYILIMENTKGLSKSDCSQFMSELSKLNITDINCNGTTLQNNDLMPGDTVKLIIECYYKMPEIKIEGMISYKSTQKKYKINIIKESVVLR